MMLLLTRFIYLLMTTGRFRSAIFLRGVWAMPHPIELFIRGWGVYIPAAKVPRCQGHPTQSTSPMTSNTIHNAKATQRNPQRQGNPTQSTSPMTKPMAKCKIKTFGGGEHCISEKIKRGVPGANIN